MSRRVPSCIAAVLLLGGLLLGGLGGLSACRSRASAYTVSYLDTFDTVLTVTVGATSHTEASTHTSAIHEIIKALHARFDIHAPHEGVSGLYALNHAEGKSVTIDRDTMDILLMGKDFYMRTEGKLNLCLGSATILWHEARQTGILPDGKALAEALTHIDPAALVLNETDMTATLTDPATKVDVGALAKGYAMMKVCEYAEEAGLGSLLVNLGGHILALGRHPDGNPWTVSIQSPGGGSLTTVEVENATLSTAGDYERAFTVNGTSYHHIIDPSTGYPSSAHRAATVILPVDRTHVMEADALATSLFLLPRQEGEDLLSGHFHARALWVNADGTVETTANWGS